MGGFFFATLKLVGKDGTWIDTLERFVLTFADEYASC